MNVKPILTIFLAGAALTMSAQSHIEGMEYYRADQLGNAKELLQRNMNSPQTDKSIANYYLGMIALDEGKTNEAQKYFSTGVSENPESPFNYIGLGNLDLLKGDVKSAEANFKLADKHAKKDASIQVAIARAYYNADPVTYQKEIEKHMNKARRMDLTDPDIYIFEGDIKKDSKDWGGAAGQYEMAANYDNSDAAAYVKYANLFTQVNPTYAVNKLKELLNVNPQSALGQRELANAYYNKGDYNKAASEYEKYVNNPNHFKQDEDRYAFLLFYGGRFQDGYDYATGLLSQNPNNFTARRYQFMNAANIPAMQDQLLPLAEELYSRHKANPAANKFAAIDYTLIAEEFQKDKKLDEAEAVLMEAIKENPESGNFNKQLALLYIDENQISKAADSFEEYMKKQEKPSVNDLVTQATYSFYASVENQKSNPDLAKKYMDDVVKYSNMAAEGNPGFYKPVKTLGDVAKQTAETPELAKSAAVDKYLQAVQLLEASPDPSRYSSDAKELYVYLGNYYLDQKDVDNAKLYYNKYLNLMPNDTEFRKFVDNLK